MITRNQIQTKVQSHNPDNDWYYPKRFAMLLPEYHTFSPTIPHQLDVRYYYDYSKSVFVLLYEEMSWVISLMETQFQTTNPHIQGHPWFQDAIHIKGHLLFQGKVLSYVLHPSS